VGWAVPWAGRCRGLSPARNLGGVLASLMAAVAAALCYGVASVMQAVAVRAASRRPAGGPPAGRPLGQVDPGLLVRMLGQWRFVLSLGLDLAGFGAQLVALRRLPLFAVQAIVAGNLAVTAVMAVWLIGARLAWREWLAVSGVVVGVGLLGLSAGAEGATAVSGEFKVALLVTVGAVAVAGVAASRLRGSARTLALGAAAGLGFGVVAVSARVLPGFSVSGLVRDPAAYAVVAAGIVAFALYATALEHGSVTVATAAVVLAETAPPALVGVLFLGDHPRRGLAGLAVAAFVLAVACALALARFGEAEKNQPDPAAVGPSRPGGGEPQASTVR
jgi:drug/metabolite transporter (DMT)-like permease